MDLIVNHDERAAAELWQYQKYWITSAAKGNLKAYQGLLRY